MFDSGLNVINPTDRIVRSGGSVVVGAAGQVTVTPKAGQNMVLASGQLVAPVGSAAAPSYTFAGRTDTGVFSPAAQTLSLVTAGTQRLMVDPNGLTFAGVSGAVRSGARVPLSRFETQGTGYENSGVGMYWPTTTADQGPNLSFVMNNASAVPVRYGLITARLSSATANAEAGYLSIYTVYNGTEGERVRVNPSGSVTFYADAISGVSQINASGTAPLAFYTNGTSRWSIDASGNLLGSTDNAYNIGASGANRPANVYVAGAVAVGTNPAATVAIRLANNAGVYARNSTNSADVNLIVLDASDVTKVQGQNGLVFNSGSGGGITINCQAGSMAMYGSNSGDILIIPQAGRALFLSNVCTITQGGGVQVGSPTGGDLGGGKINVSGGIYLNGTAYTNPDYVFEHYFTGAITKNAGEPGAADYRGLARLADVRRFAREHWHLPGLSRDDDLFRRAAHTLEKVEEAYLYLFDHEARLVRLEELDRRLRAVEAVLA